jgi:SnoaL-like domain
MVQSIVEGWFQAMRRGRDGEAELIALFAVDARYTEPFSGRTHRGHDAIRDYFSTSWDEAPADLVLTVDRVDVQGQRAVARWCCRSPALPGPVWGEDRYLVEAGKIRELVTVFIDAPDRPA